MHPKVFQEFEKLSLQRNICGNVLEIGAIPSDKSLLCMKSLDNAKEKIGINLKGPYRYKDFTIVKGNANFMQNFKNEQFDAVFCNAMLEHDKFFWKTISEIKRVTKINGSIFIGVPGYSHYKIEKLQTILKKTPIIRSLLKNKYFNVFYTSTITYQIHDAPGDYYRFSEQVFRDVFFDQFDNIEVRTIMLPPRIIGVATKKMVL